MTQFLLLMLALLSCIAAVSSGLPSDITSQLWSHSKDVKSSELHVVPSSDIRDHSRKIWIITTACLPWMTGTSINPLLRAAYLAKDRPEGMINLLVPWLDSHDQQVAYPSNLRFKTPQDQRDYIRNWLAVDANLPRAAKKLNIVFYSAKFVEPLHSVFPMGDISTLIPDEDADVCVLEEPEHLNWFMAPFISKKWMDKFKHVIGIIHTNYVMYARTESSNLLKELWIYYYNKAVVRAYCHKVIKLSGALQVFAPEKEVISNVHGVREKYLQIGDAVSTKRLTKGAYFVGKLANAKGLLELFHLLDYVKSRTGQHIPVDVYGSGPHEKEIKRAASKRKLSVKFLGTIDHALLTDYKVFVNPSLSEVLCTTIVEAIAMGKWVVCAKHPSNQFFEQFPNCLTFKSQGERCLLHMLLLRAPVYRTL